MSEISQPTLPCDTLAQYPRDRNESPTNRLRPELPGKATAVGSNRYAFIDGLRGIACLAVVLCHVTGGVLHGPLAIVMPEPLDAAIAHGWLGVQIFFVISGFVISHALASTAVTPRYAGNFLLRRSVRLDPVYWVMIVVSLALFASSGILTPGRVDLVPSWGAIALNCCYLQELTGCDTIVAGAWTLCMEFQFYLVFIGFLCLVQCIAPRSTCPESYRSALHLALLVPPTMISIGIWAGDRVPFRGIASTWWFVVLLVTLAVVATATRRAWAVLGGAYVALLVAACSFQGQLSWFLPNWSMFILGDLISRVLRRELPMLVILTYAALMGLAIGRSVELGDAAAQHTGPLAQATALATGAAILLCGKLGCLSTWLSNRPIQYFGQISYSLYLTHFEIGGRVMNVGHRLTGNSVPAACGWWLLALGLSIASAHLLNRWVERPAQRLSQWLKPA